MDDAPLKVLVVEDEQAALELLAEILSSEGAAVTTANNGLEAAALINREKYDGIFLDLVIPGIDGWELSRQIRRSKKNSGTPIVVVTALGDKDTMAKAFAAGATFFLSKPLTRTSMVRLLNITRGIMMDERRKHRRGPARLEVTCQTAGRTIKGVSYDISEEGALFQGDGSMGLGNKVRLSFRSEDEPEIQVEGTVVRTEGDWRVGIRFSNLTPQTRERIRRIAISAG